MKVPGLTKEWCMNMARLENTADTSFTHRPICPYCGYIQEDSSELFSYESVGDEDKEHDCHRCGKTCFLSRHVSITYSTLRIEG
jgi:hypothetical protein